MESDSGPPLVSRTLRCAIIARMLQAEWQALFVKLQSNLDTVRSWPEEQPDLSCLRCAQSKHRTLAHLRACQEQWLKVAQRFASEHEPRFTILHPWRLFEANSYASFGWQEHLSQFINDRRHWLTLRDNVDPTRGGCWNRRSDTIFTLTERLVEHETFHIAVVNNSSETRHE